MTEQFHRPATVREAVGLKRRFQARAAYLAGGTWLNSTRQRRPARARHQPGGAGARPRRDEGQPGRDRRDVHAAAPDRRPPRAGDAQVGAGAGGEPQRARDGHAGRPRRRGRARQRRDPDAAGARGGASVLAAPGRHAPDVPGGVRGHAGAGAGHEDPAAEAEGGPRGRLPRLPGLGQRALAGERGGLGDGGARRAEATRSWRWAAWRARWCGSSAVEQALAGRPLPSLDELQALVGARGAACATRSRGSAAFRRYEAGAVVALAFRDALAGKGARAMRISVTVNGTPRTFEVRPGERVRDLLRREHLLSVRNGCDGAGHAAAPARSCSTAARSTPACCWRRRSTAARSAPSSTWRRARELSAIQTAFLDAGVVQCGYCTPAMLLATEELLAAAPRARRASRCADAFSGIFCRCTGYEQMFAAVELAAQRLHGPGARGGDRGRSSATTCACRQGRRRRWTAPRLVRGEQGVRRGHGRARHLPPQDAGLAARARLHQAHRHAPRPRRCRAWCWS